MKNRYIYINCILVSLSLIVTSCIGQVNPNVSNGINNHKLQIAGQAKIVRTLGVTSGNIGCELQDNAGNIWFSTGGEGIYRFDGKSFTNFTTKDGLCNNYISSIIQDKTGNILIGTNAGICKFDGKIFSNFFETDTLNKLRIISLMEDKEGNIWFGAMDHGIYRFDGKRLTNFLHQYQHPYINNKQEGFISDIIQDKNGNIWFSSFNRGGVWRYDGKALTQLLPSSDYYLFNENEGSNPNSAAVTKYLHIPEFITDDMIQSITEDKTGNIWFATRRHGACRYDGKTFSGFRERVLFGLEQIKTASSPMMENSLKILQQTMD